jgi:hypothetical protein
MINNGNTASGVYNPMKKCSLFLLLAVLNIGKAGAQGANPQHLLDEIGFYSDVVVNASDDQHRARSQAALTSAMDSLLALPSSYDITLDSIRWLSVLHGDGFRIVTWQWKVTEEEYKYGGFIQWPTRLVMLKDTRPFINGSEYNTYTANAWYGALYYQLLPFEREGKKYYVLLGFNAENSTVNIKVADVLDLTGPDVKFGVPVFVGLDEPMTRIMLTYADVSTVHIRYDTELGGIIYDHLQDLPGVGDNGQTMPVSDGSLVGWILKDGNWNYQDKVYDVKVDTPPMSDDRKDRKEDKDILGRPHKQ